MTISESNAYFISCSYNESDFVYFLNNSNVCYYGISLNDNINETYKLKNSHLSLVDIYYDELEFECLDPQSEITYRWSFGVQLLDPDGEALNNEQVSIIDKNGDTQKTGVTDSNGRFLGIIAKERSITQSGVEYFNPFKIHINDYRYQDDIPVSIIHPVNLTLYSDGDLDRDGIFDSYEIDPDEIHFSAFDLALTESQMGYYKGSEAIVNIEDILTNKSVLELNTGDYKLHLQMNTFSHIEDLNVTVRVSNTTNTLLTQAFMINNQPRFFSTDVFHFSDDVASIEVYSSSGNTENMSFILTGLTIEKVTSDFNQILDPLCDDLDLDGLDDGLEFNENTCFIEAEEMILDTDQIVSEPDASNRSAVDRLANGTIVSSRIDLSPGTYDLYIKARSNGRSTGNLTVTINDTCYSVISVNDTYNWYHIDDIEFHENSILIKVFDNNSEGIIIDKLIIDRNISSQSDSQFTQEFFSYDNRIPQRDRIIPFDKWVCSHDRYILSKPAVYNNVVFYSTLSGSIIKVNRETGAWIDESIIVTNINDITYASSPVINEQNNIAICYFEEGNGDNDAIVGFYLNNLTQAYQISVSTCYEIERSGIISYDSYFYYCLSGGGMQSTVVSRQASNGNLFWSYACPTSTYLTRPMINSTQNELYFGSDDGILYKVDNINNQNHNLFQTQVQSSPDMRSVLLDYDPINMITLTYNGFVIKINKSSGSIYQYPNTVQNGFQNRLITLDSTYLYYCGVDGNLTRYNLDAENEEFSDILVGEGIPYLTENEIIISYYTSIKFVNRNNFNLIREYE
ncbi:MAG: hypothetical protein DRP46_12840, partial [Candidatus Zixiibacteriota bacterium]